MKRIFGRFSALSVLATSAKAIALLVILIAAASMMSTAAQATVSGILDTGSTGSVTATLTSLSFSNDPAAQPATGGANFSCPLDSPACNSDVSSSTVLSFAGCAGILGTGTCLTAGEGVDVSGGTITAASVPENNFLTFSNNSNLVFSLTGIDTYVGDPGVSTDCAGLSVGQSCTAYVGSPVLLTVKAGGSTDVSFDVTGIASDTGVAGLANGSVYQGGFTQHLPSESAAAIQMFFCGTNANPTITTCLTYEAANPNLGPFEITSSQSGSFAASAVPEPNTLALMLIGGLLIGVTRIRRRA